MVRHLILVLTSYMFLVSIAPNMQGSQLLNIPRLVSHYNQFHKAEGMSFREFLLEHYVKCKTDNDTEHRKLPFKSVIQVCSIFYLNQPENLHANFQITDRKPIAKKVFFSYCNGYFSKNYFSIWHPPQLV